jgi:glycosyltransferase 2 family protein
MAGRVLVPVTLLALLVWRVGTQPFHEALSVLTPLPILAALVLGCVAFTAQASRWRMLMAGAGLPLAQPVALAECYRAGALNTVLPGGVAGDVLRAWRQRTGAPGGWRPAAVAVLADRAIGLCVLLTTAACAFAVEGSTLLAAGLAIAALVSFAVGRTPLNRLEIRHRAAIWGWSVLLLSSLLGLTAVAAVAIGGSEGPGVVVILGIAALAGMAVPFNLGGWGPREAAGAFAAILVGAPSSTGVAIAAGYGLLSAVSVLPGFVVLVRGWLSRPVRRGSPKIELHTDVVAEDEAARRCP